MDMTFGPVPSRRLGRSLGINNIPPKHCSYACIYCQVGPTPATEIEPHPFFSPQEIHQRVAARLETLAAAGERVDYLSFVPDGEPTLDSHLGESIQALKALGLPIAVISNASLLWRHDTRAALAGADWVSVKVDSLDPAKWRRINRPHPDLDLLTVLDGIRSFAREYTGTLSSETMLVAGLNDTQAEIDSLGQWLVQTGIRRAWLAVPHRPPSVAAVGMPDESVMIQAWLTFCQHGLDAELLTGYEGDAFSLAGDPARELLAIAAVHPLRQSALEALLGRAGAEFSLLERLLREGLLKQVQHAGETFYMRPLPDHFHTP